MSTENDQHRAVRVELEGDEHGSIEVPFVEGETGPRWPMFVGLIAVVATILAFAVLRPGTDEAADGTQRVAPTTAPATSSSTTPTSTTPTSTPTASSSTPPTTAFAADFAAIAEVDPALGEALESAEEIAPLSVFGVDGPPEAVADPLGAFVETDDAVLLEDILRFDEVIVEQLPFAASCESYSGPVNDFTISQCRDFFIEGIREFDEDGREVPRPLDDVELGSIGLNNSEPGFGECVAIASAEMIPGFVVTPTGSESSFAFAGDGDTAQLFGLADGRIAVIDGGTVGVNASCDVVGGFFSREPGLVIIDPTAEAASVLPAPFALAPTFLEGTDAEILGEVQVGETRSHILIRAARSLWSVDTEVGVWRLITIAGSADSGEFPYVLSESSARLYGLIDDSFQLIDLSTNADGSLAFSAQISPILSQIARRAIGDGGISFATDDEIFVSSGTNTFSFVAMPPPPAEPN